MLEYSVSIEILISYSYDYTHFQNPHLNYNQSVSFNYGSLRKKLDPVSNLELPTHRIPKPINNVFSNHSV